jgi:YHS domain-containing protein
MRWQLLLLLPLLLLVNVFIFAAPAEKSPDKPAATTQPAAAAATQPAPVNKKCPVSGEDVDAKGKTVQYKGKTVGFCCDDCIELFNKNPDKYADKLK